MAFYSYLNELLALINRAKRYYITSEDTANLNACVIATQKSFIKDIKALLRTSAKYSLRQRLKGRFSPTLSVGIIDYPLDP